MEDAVNELGFANLPYHIRSQLAIRFLDKYGHEFKDVFLTKRKKVKIEWNTENSQNG